ncbi:pseudouridine synthase [Podospora appendiculata]|uniref:Pseudouridine synthase n=1 Tax=Podospora appendiculata TaxID=314037 RepID=A0AAE0X1K0_9PEZI|nr:pseudouridine synthase [Podospora appendiculata]
MSRQGTHVPAVRAETEKSLGITQRSAAINWAFTADIRKRFTDFLVYEIARDGTVIHLREYEEDEAAKEHQLRHVSAGAHLSSAQKPTPPPTVAPAVENQPPVQPIPEADRIILAGLIQQSAAEKLVKLDEDIQAKKPLPKEDKSVVFDPVNDRAQRAVIHQEVRRIFSGRVETLADGNGVITAIPSKWAASSRGKSGANQGLAPRRSTDRFPPREQHKSYAQLGGEYLHFTLYKENKDTMDALNTIARLLKIKSSNFGFAGTKDRRAGTVQRISVARQRVSNMMWLNSRLPNIKIGDFKHAKEPLQLGQHGGNEFVITLKNCQPVGGIACSVERRVKMIQESVECGLSYMKHHGYINYFGLQRFGTYSIGTHLLGMKILKGDYEGVVDDILHVEDHFLAEVLEGHPQNGNESQNRDDYGRAAAITTWKTTRNAARALELLPKRFSSEWALIRHLGNSPKDFMGALLSITRGMRMMYIHAYQSYIWNYLATRRWSMYGDRVIEGDLVLVGNGKYNGDSEDPDATMLEATTEDENFYAQTHALTAEDVASGKYTIFDIVLPTPGYDVMYPRNDIGDYYATFMQREENGGLDPYNMRRRHKEFSLSGNYRHIIGRFIGEPQYAIRVYSDDTEQMHPTDLDFCNHKRALARAEKAAKAQASAPTMARWAHFANNPAEYDNALASDRRRKASQEPLTTDIVTNETWVETGVDGSAKRVKVARHEQQYQMAVKHFESPGGVSLLSPGSELASQVTQPLQDIVNIPSTPIGVDAVSLDTPARDSSPKPSLPSVGTDQHPPIDALNWYGSNLPTIPPVVDPTTQVGGYEKKEGSPPTVAEVAPIVMPVFHTPSDNPLVAVNDCTKCLGNDPDATKIAVILKFQLKTSNYATIVLRELMGSNIEDNTRATAASPPRV